MTRKTEPCCGARAGNGDPAAGIPEPIRKDLDALGGLPALKRSVPPETVLEKRGKIYQALSDPIRLTILYIIRDQPLCVCVINQFMQLSGPKLSYHLNILKESGLVEGKNDGNWIIYSITERGRRLLQCTENAGNPEG